MMKLIEFTTLIQNKTAFINYLIMMGIFAVSMRCPDCGAECLLNKDNLQYRCCKRRDTITKNKKITRQVRCSFKKSARVGTFFEVNTGLQRMALVIGYFLELPHPRFHFMQRELSLSLGAIVDWSDYCTEVCMKWTDDNLSKLGGIGKTVEVDEAKFGRRKYNRRRVIDGQWLFGGIERESRRIFIVPIENRSAETLIGIIKEWIEPGTTIMSDCWKSYDRLEEEGFQHLVVNHSYNFVDLDSAWHVRLKQYYNSEEHFTNEKKLDQSHKSVDSNEHQKAPLKISNHHANKSPLKIKFKLDFNKYASVSENNRNRDERYKEYERSHEKNKNKSEHKDKHRKDDNRDKSRNEKDRRGHRHKDKYRDNDKQGHHISDKNDGYIEKSDSCHKKHSSHSSSSSRRDKSRSDTKLQNSNSESRKNKSCSGDSSAPFSSSLSSNDTPISNNEDFLIKNILGDNFNISPVKASSEVNPLPSRKHGDKLHKIKIQKPQSTDVLGDILKDMNKCDPHI